MDDAPWLAIVLCVVIPAVLAWGVTEAIKRAWLMRYKMSHEGIGTIVARERMWWAPLLVFLSIGLGAVVGLFVGSVGWEPDYGAAVGAGSGVLASAIVKVVSARLGALADKIPGMPRG